MMTWKNAMNGASALVLAAALNACQAGTSLQSSGYTTPVVEASQAQVEKAQYELDAEAIKAMAGNYKVRFDFLETVAFTQGYNPKERYVSGGYEVVRVIEERPGFISLQHILVVGGDAKMPVKHWRQDWIFEPSEVLTFIGGNAWEMRPVSMEERKGKWAQVVYQVDDSPRYGALAAWSHANGVSQWVPPARMRPLPRRDMTTRDDYHAVLAVNRHAITPTGWVHEQDNSKLVLGDNPHVLVREVGVNTYERFDDFDVDVAEDYWSGTAAYWGKVRDAWTQLEDNNDVFALTLKGEPTDLYMALLDLSARVEEGDLTVSDAAQQAQSVIAQYTTTAVGPLKARLRTTDIGDASAR